ncbi:MAG: NAD(P)/FAD-dependent oxidoreductase [Acidobacteria bacterium]|nr:NAD(P)/FAD-dependent oxidoreductase [Acidobacteriota bacterium]
MNSETVDVAIVGCGAAGLATAIFCGRGAPHLRIACLDGAARVGAKILVSGGGRCNVTNRVVTEADYWGGSNRFVRSVLRAFSAEQAEAFFAEIGVALHEEEDGKLFPDSNRARTVLDALLAEVHAVGAMLHGGRRVTDVRRDGDLFTIDTAEGQTFQARALVLAAGGRSLPKTGSNGAGYEIARRLGHGYVETTPALAPMLLDGDRHAALSGVSHPAALMLRGAAGTLVRLEGALLWTHFGISGPAALNLSRHWHRAQRAGEDVDTLLSVCPRDTFESLEQWLREQESSRPRALVTTVLAAKVPAAIAQAWTSMLGIEAVTMAHLSREDRRGLIRALIELPLAVRDSRGYNYAEVTAGGIPLEEIDPARMASRVCPGLYLVGEMLNVDGRLGGFNFQWAWSSGWVAGRAIARSFSPGP